MKGVNIVIAAGNLGRDVESRLTPSGTKVATINIGCSYSVKDGSGGWTDKTEWIKAVVWSPSDWLCNQLKRGQPVHVQGRLQTRSWDDQQGQKRYATEVICNAGQVIPCAPIRAEQAGNVSSQGEGSAPRQEAAAAPSAQGDWKSKPVADDDIPF